MGLNEKRLYSNGFFILGQTGVPEDLLQWRSRNSSLVKHSEMLIAYCQKRKVLV